MIVTTAASIVCVCMCVCAPRLFTLYHCLQEFQSFNFWSLTIIMQITVIKYKTGGRPWNEAKYWHEPLGMSLCIYLLVATYMMHPIS